MFPLPHPSSAKAAVPAQCSRNQTFYFRFAQMTVIHDYFHLEDHRIKVSDFEFFFFYP